MAKTSGALARHADAGLPYIPVLTHPTTAGVMASFSTLRDVILGNHSDDYGFGGRIAGQPCLQDSQRPAAQALAPVRLGH